MSKHTPTQLHAIEFSGNWLLMDEPFYEGNNLLDADDVGEEQAKENAERMASIWNAMEGLSNEQVEGMRSLIKEMNEYINDTFSHDEEGDELRSKLIEQSQQYIKP